jgi:hypothetical protein
MKKLSCFAVVFLVAVRVLAGDLPLAQSFNTQSGTVLSASPVVSTNLLNSSNTTNTYGTELCLYHTFQIKITCTNDVALILDRSLDAVTWLPFYTNSTTSAAIADTTLTGHWAHIRGRFLGTNATCTVLYLGGR